MLIPLAAGFESVPGSHFDSQTGAYGKDKQCPFSRSRSSTEVARRNGPELAPSPVEGLVEGPFGLTTYYLYKHVRLALPPQTYLR